MDELERWWHCSRTSLRTQYTLEEIEVAFGTEVRDAVDALTRREGESYAAFVDRVKVDPIARRVKIADIEDNMNLLRLEDLDDAVLDKVETYHTAWTELRALE